MTYRKFKADYLFTGREMADGGSVLITTEDGTVQEILPSSEAGEGIELLRGVLSPGFINCHCHLELSHLKGALPEKAGLVDFLLAVMQQRSSAGASPGAVAGQPAGSSAGLPSGSSLSLRAAPPSETAQRASIPSGSSPARVSGASIPSGTPEWIQAAIAAAEESMLSNGIVAVGDICNTTHSLAQKMKSRLTYHNFIETIGFIEHSAPDRFENSRKVFDAFARANPKAPFASNSLVPHAPYSVSSRLFGLIADFPGNHLLTIHNQESEAENDFYRSGQGDFLRLYRAMGLDTSFFRGTGKRSLESYLPHFYRNDGHGPDGLPPNQSLILVHNVATNEEDLQFAISGPHLRESRSPDLFFCLCPNANLFIGGELPDLELLIRNNCSIVMGTDSLASNHQLNILEELKTLQQQCPQVATPTLLKWATVNGAEALELDAMLGSFQPGKRPGVVLIEGLEEMKFTAGSVARRIL